MNASRKYQLIIRFGICNVQRRSNSIAINISRHAQNNKFTSKQRQRQRCTLHRRPSVSPWRISISSTNTRGRQHQYQSYCSVARHFYLQQENDDGRQQLHREFHGISNAWHNRLPALGSGPQQSTCLQSTAYNSTVLLHSMTLMVSVPNVRTFGTTTDGSKRCVSSSTSDKSSTSKIPDTDTTPKFQDTEVPWYQFQLLDDTTDENMNIGRAILYDH